MRPVLNERVVLLLVSLTNLDLLTRALSLTVFSALIICLVIFLVRLPAQGRICFIDCYITQRGTLSSMWFNDFRKV